MSPWAGGSQVPGGTRGKSSLTRVGVSARPLWRMRLRRRLPRVALYALVCWGILASARFAIAPPAGSGGTSVATALPDRAAEAFALQAVRAYLTWGSSEGRAEAPALPALLGEAAAEAPTEVLGLRLPPSAHQRVLTELLVQVRAGPGDTRFYTVAAQLGEGAMRYLSMPIARDREGALMLAGYPAFVGAPAQAAFRDLPESFPQVQQAALQVVVERALRNYLAGSGSELAADLTSGARLSLPPNRLELLEVQQLRWLPGGGSLFARVQAGEADGARYTLEYELDVEFVAGRWEVAAIQVNPFQG